MGLTDLTLTEMKSEATLWLSTQSPPLYLVVWSRPWVFRGPCWVQVLVESSPHLMGDLREMYGAARSSTPFEVIENAKREANKRGIYENAVGVGFFSV